MRGTIGEGAGELDRRLSHNERDARSSAATAAAGRGPRIPPSAEVSAVGLRQRREV